MLLIGYGNPLRRDDGVGQFIAGQFKPSRPMHVIGSLQLTPEMVEQVSQAERVIFADADAALCPGQIRIQTVERRSSALLHRVDPGTLLDWSWKLYGRAPEAFIVRIGCESFDVGEGLSPAVERAAREALPAIRKLLHCPASHNQANEEQDQEDNKENLRDSRRSRSNSAKSENRCQDGNH
jgi:hydrogenase maturation protease